MAWGDASSPARFGYGQSTTDDRNLFLKMAGGEVLAAFTERVYTMDKHVRKQVAAGKSWQFPKTWKATAEMHSAGAEMLGNDIDTTEIVVTADELIVAHTAIYDLDTKMSHFDVTGEFTKELGAALARYYDKNVMRQIILAARTAADGPFPGGNVITDATLTSSSGSAWIAHIREANIALFNKNVPEDMPRYLGVSAAIFDAIKYATDANGNYLVLNRDYNHAGGGGMVANRQEAMAIDNVIVFKSNTLPSSNDTSDTSINSKYRANYSTTTGVMWCPQAVATVELIGIGMEVERDVRRQEDFFVAKMAVGHGTLRPECAVEFKTA